MKAKELLKNLGVRKVIFNGKTTIVYLTTGEKGVANCGEDDEFDPVVGIAMAYLAAESQGSKRELKEAVDYMYKKGSFENENKARYVIPSYPTVSLYETFKTSNEPQFVKLN